MPWKQSPQAVSTIPSINIDGIVLPEQELHRFPKSQLRWTDRFNPSWSGLEGSVLDGLAEWPAFTTLREWFAITRQLIQQTIADMDLDPDALAEVEEAFIGAGLL